MKAKPLSLALAALLALGALWLARSAWRAHEFHKSSTGLGSTMPRGSASNPNRAATLPVAFQLGATSDPNNQPQPRQISHSPPRLAPPDPNRRFTDFTPEQRVQFARQGHGPGG